jgi:YidC/Oxa1 family membrane protein insertase
VNKRDTTIGVLLIVAAFFCIWYSAKNSRRLATPAAVEQKVAHEEQSTAPKSPGVVPLPPLAGTPAAQPAFAAANPDKDGVVITALENSYVRVEFTDFGGAVRDVALKKYAEALGQPGRFILNKLHADPMLAFVDYPGLDRSTRFQLVSQTADTVVYRAVLDGRLEVTRQYVLSPDQSDTSDPYRLRAETTFRNLTDQTMPSVRVTWALGTAAPTSPVDLGQYLATGYSDGKDQSFTLRSKLEASGGFFGLNAHDAAPVIQTEAPIVWATVKNQFFCSILTPDAAGLGVISRRIKLFSDLPDESRNAWGIAGAVELAVPALAPHGSATLGANLYTGPNEYHRLANTDIFKAGQSKVVQFGFFGLFSEILLTLLTWVHASVHNWGLSIICTTLLLRVVMMAFTIPASRSARRMQKIQPELKAIKEKYKDNPTKQQTATMEVFKKHKINPVGGCLPMLLTLPFFWGFYAMLRTAPELRFAPFLWARDLSAPDTVFTFGHVPFLGSLDINILPILLCVVTFLQMRVTPQPTVDNAQAKMMKFTPLMFMVFCYTFSCALALYSTTNGLFMIGQQLLVNRMKDDGDPTHAKGVVEKPGGKPIKNVTPAKKK